MAPSTQLPRQTFSNTWMHTGMLLVDGEKMSKSLGNFFTLAEVLEQHSAAALRLLMLQTSYRSPLDFSDARLAEADTSYGHLCTTVRNLRWAAEHAAEDAEGNPSELDQAREAMRTGFVEAMDDDFNTAGGLAAIFSFANECNRFLESHDRMNAADREAALAYALGFVCHFALDSTCHPFVEQFTRESGVTHCEIETEFDNMLLRRDGYDPLTFFTASHIHPSAANARVIAPFYKDISEQTALEALKGMILVHKVLQASNPVKRWVVLTGMKVLGKYDGMHGLVANPQPNPQCTESNRKLDALYAKALPLAERLILEYVAKLDTDEPLDAAYDHTFGEF